MRKNFLYIVLIVLINLYSTCICLDLIFGVLNSSDPVARNSYKHYYATRYYSFDGKKAYYAIQKGMLPSLIRISEEDYYIENTLNPLSINWTEKEILAIKDRFLAEVEAEKYNRFTYIEYIGNCATKESIDFTDYEIAEISRLPIGVRENTFRVLIDTKENEVMVIRVDYYPVYTSNLKPFRLDRMNLAYQDVIKIAEDFGGTSKREAVNNDCRIYVTYDLRNEGQNWEVNYKGAEFVIKINDLTEKVVKTN